MDMFSFFCVAYTFQAFVYTNSSVLFFSLTSSLVCGDCTHNTMCAPSQSRGQNKQNTKSWNPLLHPLVDGTPSIWIHHHHPPLSLFGFTHDSFRFYLVLLATSSATAGVNRSLAETEREKGAKVTRNAYCCVMCLIRVDTQNGGNSTSVPPLNER